MASGGYDHQAIEAKWQKYWLEHKTFKTELDRSKPKYYILDMFPYPSGDGLHVGHPEGYTATDIVVCCRSRFSRFTMWGSPSARWSTLAWRVWPLMRLDFAFRSRCSRSYWEYGFIFAAAMAMRADWSA